MSKQHTPGPWRLEEVADDAGRIKHLCPVGTDDLSLLTVVEHNGVKFAAVYSDADARLIAAAPELLEALQSIADCCDEDHAARDYASRQTEIRGIARYAIAKATGEA